MVGVMRNQHQADLRVVPVKLDELKGHKLAHLTGTDKVKFTDPSGPRWPSSSTMAAR
jgi:hypothetical protein